VLATACALINTAHTHAGDWPAIASMWRPHVGGGTPRDFGPCADVLDRNASMRVRHLERRHTYVQSVPPPAVEPSIDGLKLQIAERKKAEAALRELNETLEKRVQAETRERLQIWNNSQDLLVIAGFDGKYLSVNPAWTEILGWSEVDLLGKSSQ